MRALLHLEVSAQEGCASLQGSKLEQRRSTK